MKEKTNKEVEGVQMPPHLRDIRDPFTSEQSAGTQKEKEENVCLSCEG